jgi:3-dehydroquinate dehydratase-2|tara:strand:+ start:78 stop:497 length:420 start_codon:yes stop_codon:yes gene_type:complete
MTKVLVLHGRGMELRGTKDLDIFGPMKLPEYDDNIRKYASELGVEVEIFHSNEESEVVAKIKSADVDGALINPAGYTTGHPDLVEAIKGASFPTLEVHMSNPASRGRVSEVAPACKGVITGFGITGYYLGLKGVKELTG